MDTNPISDNPVVYRCRFNNGCTIPTTMFKAKNAIEFQVEIIAMQATHSSRVDICLRPVDRRVHDDSIWLMLRDYTELVTKGTFDEIDHTVYTTWWTMTEPTAEDVVKHFAAKEIQRYQEKLQQARLHIDALRSLDSTFDRPTPVVVCAAIRHRQSGDIIVSARHFDPLMRKLIEQHAKGEAYWYESIKDNEGRNMAPTEQGFINQYGEYLTRAEAWQLAAAKGQIERKYTGALTECLISEALY